MSSQIISHQLHRSPYLPTEAGPDLAINWNNNRGPNRSVCWWIALASAMMNVVGGECTETQLWSVADQLWCYKWPHFVEEQILSFQSGMLTVQEQRSCSAEKVEVILLGLMLIKPFVGWSGYFCRHSDTKYGLIAQQMKGLIVTHVSVCFPIIAQIWNEAFYCGFGFSRLAQIYHKKACKSLTDSYNYDICVKWSVTCYSLCDVIMH